MKEAFRRIAHYKSVRSRFSMSLIDYNRAGWDESTKKLRLQSILPTVGDFTPDYYDSLRNTGLFFGWFRDVRIL